jgi:hypothetical protein
MNKITEMCCGTAEVEEDQPDVNQDYENQNRIIGGGPAELHEFPWIVRIVEGCALGRLGSESSLRQSFFLITVESYS